MSDLDDIDLDLEPEDLHLADEQTPPAGKSKPFARPQFNSAVLLKAGAAVVVLAVGGAYFVMSRHAAPPARPERTTVAATRYGLTAAPTMPLSPPPVVNNGFPPAVPHAPPPKNTANPLAWDNSAVPSPMPAPPKTPITPRLVEPSIVNDLPPSAAMLKSAGGAAPSTKPGGPSAASAFPAQPLSPLMPDSIPLPNGKSATSMAGLGTPSARQQQPVRKVTIKGGEAMPSVTVPPVARMEIGKSAPATIPTQMVTAPNQPNQAVAPDQAAKVADLEKKIADLETTIAQLQQAAVVKEDVAEKPGQEESAKEASATPAPKKVHKKVSKPRSVRHKARAIVTAWILKAAKPGQAWVIKKGESDDDLQMVVVGNSLPGIGRVTSIDRDSMGYWAVNGTKGRIKQ